MRIESNKKNTFKKNLTDHLLSKVLYCPKKRRIFVRQRLLHTLIVNNICVGFLFGVLEQQIGGEDTNSKKKTSKPDGLFCYEQ